MPESTKKPFTPFFIVWIGQFASSIGSGLTAFSLGIYAFEATHSATSYSLIILFGFLPSFLLQPIGGVLSDRYDRRLMMILGDIGSAVGLVFLLCMLYAGMESMWMLYLGAAFSSVFAAVHNPAYKASVTDLVDSDSYAKASGLVQLAESSRYLISPIVAGVLLHATNISMVLFVDIATFAVAAVTVLFVKSTVDMDRVHTVPAHILDDLKSGLSYTFSHRGLPWLLVITSLVTFSVGFVQTLLGPMILTFTDARTLGITFSLAASGMLISSVFIGTLSRTRKHSAVLSIAMAFAGFFYFLLGISVNIYFIGLTGFFFFCALPFINTSLDVLIRGSVENHMQGRVWSIVSVITQFGMVAAFGISGILADNVFNPLLQANGAFAGTIGRFIGTGQGRGIGLMFMLAGILVMLIAFSIGKMKFIGARAPR